MTDDATDRLLSPYRTVRRVASPADGPWSGVLVRSLAGSLGVLVDASALPDEWAGWGAAAAGHVAAPLDLVRTAGGHEVLLPVCVERLEDFVRRRRDAGVPIGPGEAVTIGVSLVRAIAELGSLATGANGGWWLTDDRRPVIVTDAGQHTALAATLAVAREVSEDVPDPVWRAVEELVVRETITERECARVEDRLFALCESEALADAPLSPRRSFAAIAPGLEPRRAREGRIADDMDAEARGGWVDQLSRHVDADLADAVSRATTGVWRRLRTTRGGRRAPWLVAAAVGGVVLAGGLLWPGSGSQPVAADPGTPAPTASRSAAGSDHIEESRGADASAPTEEESAVAASAPQATSTSDAQLDTIVDRLLSARTACDEDVDCLSEVIAPGADQFPAGVIDVDADDRTVSFVDEFGGVAVLRADHVSGEQPSQLIVVQQDGRRWLLRDVYAAQQP